VKRDKSPSEALLRRRAFYLQLPRETLRAILGRKSQPEISCGDSAASHERATQAIKRKL
jgi:hypothetical protein